MKYLSVCSGIEAATVAWHPLGWEPVAFSEIEAFPSAVLAHHYPNVPNWGDMTKFKDWPDATFDVLVGGTPCQSFSVAGLREGLADPRGNLMLTYLAIARRYRPEWLVWENVPGVLSSGGGQDFASLLRGMGECGYGFAYRVLDAQYFGVAQRRRRVFVVGCAGNWQRAAAVLFERHSLSGHPAPRREARKDVAPTVAARTRGGGGLGTDFDCDVGLVHCAPIAPTLNAAFGTKLGLENQHVDSGAGMFVAHSLRGEGFDASEDGTGRGTPLVPVAFTQNQSDEVRKLQVAGAIAAEPGMKQQTYIAFNNRQDPDISGDITHQLGAKDNGMAVAFESRFARNGRGAPDTIVPPLKAQSGGSGKGDAAPLVVYQPRGSDGSAQETDAAAILRKLRNEIGAQAFAEWGLGILDSLQPSDLLRQTVHGCDVRLPTFSRNWVVCHALSREKDHLTWLVQSLREAGCVRCSSQGWQPSEQLAHELGAYLSQLSQSGAQAERFMRDLWLADEGFGILRKALSAIQEIRRSAADKNQPAHEGLQVRRLTATECEFLQGFPRNYTAIPWRGKPADQCPDGPRYKALGNSMAVPVMRWIGERIAAVESIRRAARDSGQFAGQRGEPGERAEVGGEVK